jgi:hypothetical protein
VEYKIRQAGRPACSCIITLMMEAVSTSETLVNFYEITRHNIPEDYHLKGTDHLGELDIDGDSNRIDL